MLPDARREEVVQCTYLAWDSPTTFTTNHPFLAEPHTFVISDFAADGKVLSDFAADGIVLPDFAADGKVLPDFAVNGIILCRRRHNTLPSAA